MLFKALTLVTFNTILATCAAGLTKDSVEETYSQIYSHLKTYRVTYVAETARFAPDLSLTHSKVRSYERYRSGSRIGIKEFWLDSPSDEQGRIALWRVGDFAEGISRGIAYSTRTGRPSKGIIRDQTAEQVYSLGSWGYLALVGLHSARRPDDANEFIPSSYATDVRSLINHPGVNLSQRTEEVEGHPCYVVTYEGRSGNPVFKAWLAEDLNLALVRRESFAEDSEGSYSPIIIVQCRSFFEAEPGVFLPKEVSVRSPVGKFPANLAAGEGLITNDYTLTDIEFNPEIPESDLTITFPTGLVVNGGGLLFKLRRLLDSLF